MLNTHMLSQNFSRSQKRLNNIKGKKNKVLKHKNINYYFKEINLILILIKLNMLILLEVIFLVQEEELFQAGDRDHEYKY
jgi:hypothetical protein